MRAEKARLITFDAQLLRRLHGAVPLFIRHGVGRLAADVAPVVETAQREDQPALGDERAVLLLRS